MTTYLCYRTFFETMCDGAGAVSVDGVAGTGKMETFKDWAHICGFGFRALDLVLEEDTMKYARILEHVPCVVCFERSYAGQVNTAVPLLEKVRSADRSKRKAILGFTGFTIPTIPLITMTLPNGPLIIATLLTHEGVLSKIR
jgi:hypothetical protein